jgi:pyruvate-formate lyase-activating enzyme
MEVFFMAVNDTIKTISEDKNIVCTRPWTSLEERSLLGDYRICCFINEDLGIIGKDSDKNIMDLWSGKEINRIRSLFEKNKFSEVCPQNCSLLVHKTRINKNYTDFFLYDEGEYASFSNEFSDNREKVISSIIERKGCADTFPLRLKLHPSNTCNLDCRMCQQEKKAKAHIGKNYTDNLSKLMPFLEELSIFGGEPFACKFTKEIVFGDEIKKYPHIHFSTISNGTLLNENIQEKLRAIRLGNFSFSLDSCQEKTYESIRRGAKFSQTMGNIERFVANRDAGNIRIRNIEINFTIQKVNYQEISRFIEYAHSLGIKCGFGLVTGFNELHDCIDGVRDNIENGIRVANALGEDEAAGNLSYLLTVLPEYEKKLNRLRFMYRIINTVGGDKIVFFIRRHNMIRGILQKAFGVKK